MDIKKNKKKLIVGIVVLAICTLIPLSIALAKFFKQEKIAPTNTLDEIIADFYVEITDENKDVVESIGIEDLYPGATKEVDFYVKSGEKDKRLEVDISYTISLLHTKNLPVEYTLYELNEIKDDQGNVIRIEEGNKVTQNVVQSNNSNNGSDLVTMNTETIIEFGDSNTRKFILEKSEEEDTANGQTVESYDRYRLKVHWPEDKTEDKYINEVDLVYLMINAVQERPQAEQITP